LENLDAAKYMAGGTLYLEYKLYNNKRNGSRPEAHHGVLGRELIRIDGVGLKPSTSMNIGWLVFGACVGLTFIAIIGFIIYRRKNTNDKKNV